MATRAGTFHPAQVTDDMDALNTTAKDCLVSAINEVLANQQADAAAIAANVLVDAKTVKCVHAAIGTTAPVAIPALPVGSKIIAIQAHVPTAYPSGAKIATGDHSGGAGALAATSISDGTGITATSIGEYQIPRYATPVGDLQISITGGDNSVGAATVLIHYIDA